MPDTKKVLIVDDEESIRLLLQRILASNKELEITLANGAREALVLTAERTYDLILLDLLMPDIDGVAVLTEIRGKSANRKTPVIIVSILADPQTRVACESLGVSGYIVKPIQREVVIKAVAGALAR